MVTLEKFNKDLSQIKSWAHFEEYSSECPPGLIPIK